MGLLIMFGFLAVLQIMSQRTSFRGDQGKAPMYATSQGDDSSDDKTASASKQVARVLQSRFDHGEEDTGPIGDISIETWSRRWCSIKTASVSFESYTVSNGATSLRSPTRGKGTSGGEMRAEDILIEA